MGEFKGICLLSFMATMGFLLVVLGCALPQYDNWNPLFVIFTYVLTPLPIMIAKRRGDGFGDEASVALEVALFMTAALVLSGFGIPLVLWHHGNIEGGAAGLTIAGNAVIFLSILAYSKFFNGDDGWSASI
eukprot:m.23406 g.23406  ORF g.23406 m.23406 type:complete len:131 (-) comp11043_c0_seq1:58-450(-)